MHNSNYRMSMKILNQMYTTGAAILAQTIGLDRWPSRLDLCALERRLLLEVLKICAHEDQIASEVLNIYAREHILP